jgi:hypothetical protein
VDQILGQVLREAVWERLDMLTELADRGDTSSLVSAARTELPRLADAWRSMLSAHEPDHRGDCPTCSTRWHRSKAPCSVWQAAHEHLVAGGLAELPEPPEPRRRRAQRHSLSRKDGASSLGLRSASPHLASRAG